jgi:hypothetical protein
MQGFKFLALLPHIFTLHLYRLGKIIGVFRIGIGELNALSLPLFLLSASVPQLLRIFKIHVFRIIFSISKKGVSVMKGVRGLNFFVEYVQTGCTVNLG